MPLARDNRGASETSSSWTDPEERTMQGPGLVSRIRAGRERSQGHPTGIQVPRKMGGSACTFVHLSTR